MENSAKKALLIAPMASVHRRFNKANILALQELGYSVHLAANFNNGRGSEQSNEQYIRECENLGLTIHSIPFVRAVGLKNITLVRQLSSLIKNGHFDIVHAHTETGGLLFLMAMLFIKKDFKAVYTPHGMSFYKGSGLLSQCVYRPIEKWICSKMDRNIAMNNEELSVLEKWNNKTAFFTHGVGVELDRFKLNESNVKKELKIGEETPLVVSVGELNDNKNHTVVINALARLKEYNFCYAICGVGELDKKLISQAEALGIKDKVKLLGYRKDIPNILSASDIFVFPSFHEGLPVSVMEAMASGLPVVCSKIRGNVDLIETDNGGHLYEPSNADGFAAGLKALLDNEEVRKNMSEYNRKKSELYSLWNVKTELTEAYL